MIGSQPKEDALTGLYSRIKFFETVRNEVLKATEFSAPVGLLIIDIIKFSKINKNFGHDVGDVVLQSIAEKLKTVSRSGDYLGRIGDDQFGLLLSRVANMGHAQLAAMKVQRLLDIPVVVKEREIRCSSVIGISLCPLNASEPAALLQSAERALAKAKYLGQSIVASENKDIGEVSDDWDIEVLLGESIARSELRVYFQPKVSLKTGQPVGAEALVRWESSTRGLVSPAVFLPVAEAIGFMKPLTIWMLNSALRLSSGWTEKWGRLSVSVNIPPCILEQVDFIDMVISAEKLWPRDNVDLCLEVLEESMLSDVEETFRKLNVLREQGVKIAIDDFGTGYSNLSYFRDIPTDDLKIDQSFIRGLKKDKSNAHIISLIIDLAHRFELNVVAEGVEERDELMYLKKKGCDQIQGFYFAKPMPADEFSVWLQRYQPEQDLLAV